MTTLRFVRVWLPTIVTLGGVLVIAIGRNDDALEGGAGIIGAGLSIALLNVLHRIGVTGDSDREEEDAARDYFDRHGRWPDETPPPTPAPAPPGRDVHERPPSRLRSTPRRRG